MKNKLIPFLIFSFLFQLAYADSDDSNINYLKDPSRKESIAGGFYEGRFSDGTPFQMTLPYSTSDLRASYQYPKKFTGETIGFENVFFKGDSFKLSKSYTSSRSNNGINEEFVGKLSKDKKSASGIWTQIIGNKKKNLNFSIERLIPYKHISVTQKSVDTSKHNPDNFEDSDQNLSFTFDAIFPILQNSKIQETVLKDASICSYDQECSNNITIEEDYNNLLTLRSESWGQAMGAPHGYDSFRIYHYLTNSGTSREIFLNYFFKNSPTCLAKLSQLITSELTEQEISGAKDFKLDDYKTMDFLASPLGLEFDFNPYEVGSYVEGEPSVFISKKQLGDCLIYLPETK